MHRLVVKFLSSSFILATYLFLKYLLNRYCVLRAGSTKRKEDTISDIMFIPVGMTHKQLKCN